MLDFMGDAGGTDLPGDYKEKELPGRTGVWFLSGKSYWNRSDCRALSQASHCWKCQFKSKRELNFSITPALPVLMSQPWLWECPVPDSPAPTPSRSPSFTLLETLADTTNPSLSFHQVCLPLTLSPVPKKRGWADCGEIWDYMHFNLRLLFPPTNWDDDYRVMSPKKNKSAFKNMC